MVRKTSETAAKPVKWHVKKLALIVGGLVLGVLLLVIAAQLAYPRNRALPGTSLAGRAVALGNIAVVKQALQKYDGHAVSLSLAGKVYTVTSAQAGMSFAGETNLKLVLDYPLKQRFVPFSIFFQHKQAVVGQMLVGVDDKQKFESFTDQLAEKRNEQPIEGVLRVEDGTVVEHAPKDGVAVEPKDIKIALQSLSGNLPTKLEVSGKPVPPIYDADAVRLAADKAAAYIKPFTATVSDGTTQTVPPKVVGSWLVFTPNAQTGKIDISFNNDAIKQYLTGIASKYYRGPTLTSVKLLDGKELSRQGGVQGKFLDTSLSAYRIVGALENGKSEVQLYLSDIDSPLTYDRSYSDTSAGLQAILDDWVKAHGSPRWGIKVIELDGKHREAGSNAATAFYTASMYKLFVAASALRRIDNSYLSPDEIISGSRTIDTCIDLMIVNSDNACGEAVAGKIGWGKVDDDTRDFSLLDTHLNTVDLATTAGDAATFLQKLDNGSLLDTSLADRLVADMKKQAYRNGLPAGSDGAPVADKVGFLNGYTHDAGIIYGDDHKYIISAFSYGGSWSQIADLAKTIREYLESH